MKIYHKLLLGLGGLAGALILLLGFVVYQAAAILQLKDFYAETNALVQDWTSVQMNTFALVSSRTGIITLKKEWNDSVEVFEKKLQQFTNDPRLSRFSGEVGRLIDETGSLWKLTKGQTDSTNAALDEFMNVVIGKHTSLLSADDGLLSGMNALDKDGKLDFADKFLFTKFRNYQKSITMTNASFNVVLGELRTEVSKSVNAHIRRSVIAGAALSLAVIIAAFAFARFFAVRLSRRAKSIEESMGRAAGRDFSKPPRVEGKDEIGRLSGHLGVLVESLSGFFKSVKEAVENAATLKDALSEGTARSASALNEINQNIENIKTRFETLDSAIEQAKSALGDIGVTLSDFTGETRKQTESMSEAGKELSKAVESVGSVSRQLADRARSAETLKNVVIDGGERVQSTNEIIRAIAREINSIAEVIELIDQISEQTNILSMNASIESAHAGAAGKGFAVVAEEIRKLAESTQDNAQRIGAALQSITDKTAIALETSETTARAFESINTDVIGFVGALEEIAARATTANAEAVKVAAAISESIEATRRVSEGTSEMNERHRSIQDAMSDIKSISDEALLGITEIEVGSREILGGMVKVDEISAQSKDRMTELENAMSSFVIASDSSETGVAVKSPPRSVGSNEVHDTEAQAVLHAGELSAEARLVD